MRHHRVENVDVDMILRDDGGVDVPPPDQVVVGPGGVEEVAPQHVEEETEQE